MPEFIADRVPDVPIFVGATLVDLLGGEYVVEAVTEEHFDVRSTVPAIKLPEAWRRPGVIRYRWDERCPLRPKP